MDVVNVMCCIIIDRFIYYGFMSNLKHCFHLRFSQDYLLKIEMGNDIIPNFVFCFINYEVKIYVRNYY